MSFKLNVVLQTCLDERKVTRRTPPTDAMTTDKCILSEAYRARHMYFAYEKRWERHLTDSWWDWGGTDLHGKLLGVLSFSCRALPEIIHVRQGPLEQICPLFCLHIWQQTYFWAECLLSHVNEACLLSFAKKTLQHLTDQDILAR